MTPRREIGFLRSLLGQEEDSEAIENAETHESTRSSARQELSDIAQADGTRRFESPPEGTGSGATASPPPLAPPSVTPPGMVAGVKPEGATEAAHVITDVEQSHQDLLDLESEVPVGTMEDHEVPMEVREINLAPERQIRRRLRCPRSPSRF